MLEGEPPGAGLNRPPTRSTRLLVATGSVLDGSPLWFHLLDLPATAVLYTWLFLRSRGGRCSR